jgi:hypothetical protein
MSRSSHCSRLLSSSRLASDSTFRETVWLELRFFLDSRYPDSYLGGKRAPIMSSFPALKKPPLPTVEQDGSLRHYRALLISAASSRINQATTKQTVWWYLTQGEARAQIWDARMRTAQYENRHPKNQITYQRSTRRISDSRLATGMRSFYRSPFHHIPINNAFYRCMYKKFFVNNHGQCCLDESVHIEIE